MSDTATTAYAQSKQAGIALMQSVQAEQDKIDQMNRIKAVHKHAFRTAFDYLAAMWPPANNADYFVVASKRLNEAWNGSDQDQLTHGLLMAVFNYLEWAANDEKVGIE